MARTSRGRGRRTNPLETPQARYNSLPYPDKLICFRYYRHIATNGVEGWNTREAGSIFHQRSSAYLLSCGSGSWFRHKAQSMVHLAQLFAERNEAPEDPGLPPGEQAPLAPNLPNLTTPRQQPAPRQPAPRQQQQQPQQTNSQQQAAMNHPGSPSPVNTSGRNPGGIAQASFASGHEHGLVVPTCYGVYKKFNYTSRKSSETMLIRMILNNAVTMQDIQFEWMTPRMLKLRVAWPEWFQNAEQMAAFTVDDEGRVIYPPEHPLTMDTAMRNQELVGEDNRIWDTGYLTFEQDMKTGEEPTFELLKVKNPSLNITIRVLQAVCEIATVVEGGPTTVNRGRDVNIGTGNVSSASNPNARTAAARHHEEHKDDMLTDEASDSNKKSRLQAA